MGVYIKGMEMPKKAEECRFFGDAMFGRKPYCYVRPGGSCHFPEDCPLVPVPPHGRLIDADALLDMIESAKQDDPEIADVYEDDRQIVLDWLTAAPTIISASDKDINVLGKEDGE